MSNIINNFLELTQLVISFFVAIGVMVGGWKFIGRYYNEHEGEDDIIKKIAIIACIFLVILIVALAVVSAIIGSLKI